MGDSTYDALTEALLGGDVYTTADVLGRMPQSTWHDKYIKPLGSAYPNQPWGWTKDHPTLAAFLARIPEALNALPGRSPRGAAIMRDQLLAKQLERTAPPSDPGITGGASGYAFHDQWSPHGVPTHRHSSTGMTLYDWYGMRNASTGERLPNPYPNYRGPVDPIEAMTHDISGRLARGELGMPEAPTPYERAAAQQRVRQELLQVLEGGRRRPSAPANDLE